MEEMKRPDGGPLADTCVRIHLLYGPMHDMEFDSYYLPYELMFCDSRGERIIVYHKTGEKEYRFDMEASGLRSAEYKEWKPECPVYPMTVV